MRTWILVGIVAAATFAAAGLSANAAAPPVTAAAGLNFLTPAVAGFPGEVVPFRNLEPSSAPQFTHTITADDGSFDTGLIPGGGTGSFVLPAPGTYTFTCAIHSWMKGVAVVAG